MHIVGLLSIILVMVFIVLLVKFWEIWAVILGIIVALGIIGLIYEYRDEVGKILLGFLWIMIILGIISAIISAL